MSATPPPTIDELLERGALRAEQCAAWRWRVRTDSQVDLSPWLDVDRAFDPNTSGVERLKTDIATDVARLDGSPSLVIKRYNRGKWYAPLADVFRGTRAQRAFRLALALERIDVPTARVEAFAVATTAGLPSRSCLVMRHVALSMTLAALMRDGDEAAVGAALGRAADIIADLHERGFAHRDLKSQNILVSGEAPDELALIDLDGLRFAGTVSRSRRAKNLARLRQDVPAERWGSFMQRYEAASGCRRLHVPTFRKQRR